MSAERNVETIRQFTVGVMGTDGVREEQKVVEGTTVAQLKEEGTVAFVNGVTVADNKVLEPGDEVMFVHPSAKALFVD